MIKVLLADDHDIVRAGLRRIVEESGDREVRVLQGLASGQKNREIAEACAISIKTVNTYRDRLLKKPNLGNKTELAPLCRPEQAYGSLIQPSGFTP